jgi:uncharacterized protein with HEPN domain
MPYKSPRDWRFRIGDILDAITRCRSFSEGVSRDEFLRDEKTQAAILYNLQIIGEAVNHISDQVLAEFPKPGTG